MAFVVEDGTGLSTANSYVSVQEYRDYCDDRNIDVTLETDATIQGYLVQGTDYIDLSYTFVGDPTTDTQALEFPRTYNNEDLGLPLKVKYATIEAGLALRSGEDLFNDSQKNTESAREKVGPIETEFKYSTEATMYQSNTSRFPKVNKYIKDYTIPTSNSAGMIKVLNG